MEESMPGVSRRLFSLIAIAAASAACADNTMPTAVARDVHLASAHNAQGGAEIGVTDGWFNGKTVQFFYNKDFFCKEPPASAAASDCEIGAEPEVTPRSGNIPVLYVMTPLGFDPGGLQCPVAGSCINHPSTIDASRVFGAGAEEIPLPPHSHIVDRASGGWWEIEVVGVSDPAVWAEIAEAKDLATVRELQASRPDAVTGDIPSNLFLFFSVRP
jgi:hypothetical protein